MNICTLCFLLKGDKILLAMKKRGFGEGKWNGYGGKVQEKESLKSAAVREIAEESCLDVEENNLEQVGRINFYFGGKLEVEGNVFTANVWRGEPKETEEMSPQWFSCDNLPFDAMWAADREWIPLVLSGEKIKAEIHFDASGDTVKNFNWAKADFK